MNNKGQIIITDLLLYIIVLTIILGLIIFTMETLNDTQVTRINNKELNNILEDDINLLVKTSGTPSNWEQLDDKNIKVIGLKSNNNHLISYDKIQKLQKNNHLFDNYIPNGVDYELTIYSKTNKNDVMLSSGNHISDKKQILSKNKVILIDYGYEIISFNQHDNKTQYSYYNNDLNWLCKPFTLTKTLLNEGEYYIITNSKTEYILSNTFNENITGTTNGIKNINNQLQQLLKNENDTIHIHTNNNNTKLVYDKNNRKEHLTEIIKPEPYILNLKIAV